MNPYPYLTNSKERRLPIPIQSDAYESIKKKVASGLSKRASFRQVVVEMQLNITPEALGNKFNRMMKANGRIRKNMLFTASEEEELVGILEAFSIINRPLTNSLFINHVRTLRPNHPLWDPKSWSRRFFQRHADRLSIKTIHGIKNERLSSNLLSETLNFVEYFDLFVKNNNIENKCIFNADETRFSFGMDKYSFKAIEYTGKHYNSSISNSNYKAATYIPFHTFEKLYFSFLIIPLETNGKSEFLIKKAKYLRSDGSPVYYMFTQTGWLSTEAWDCILKTFCREIRIQIPTKPIILLLDNLNIHTNIGCIKLCNAEKITSIYFPKHSTHYLQPSDSTFFAALKKYLCKKFHEKTITIASSKRSICLDLVQYIQGIEEIITKKVLQDSWSKTGIVPFNKQKIIDNVKSNCGEPKMQKESISSTNSRNFTVSVLNDSLSLNQATRISVKPLTNQIYSGEDLIKLMESNSIKKSSKRPRNNNIEGVNSIEHVEKVKRKKISNREKISKCSNCQKMIQVEAKKRNNTYEVCGYCHKYNMCKNCFNKVPELMILHEENCDKI